MGMTLHAQELERFWGGVGTADFTYKTFGKSPSARPGEALPLVSLFEWTTLDTILKDRADADVLVVRQGQLLDSPAPRSFSQARELLNDGTSLVVRQAQRYDSALALLAASFGKHFPGPVQIQLFVTPRQGRGFGWHYDAEDVFILQTVGTKDYFFRENTVNPRPRPAANYDFAAIRRERSTLMTCTLTRGDWLYIPAGWWHVATAIDDSLSISLGVLSSRERAHGLLGRNG